MVLPLPLIAAARLQGVFRLLRTARELVERGVLGSLGRLRSSTVESLNGTVRAEPRARGILQRHERLLRGRHLIVVHERGQVLPHRTPCLPK